jgi:hypothetical protein
MPRLLAAGSAAATLTFQRQVFLLLDLPFPVCRPILHAPWISAIRSFRQVNDRGLLHLSKVQPLPATDTSRVVTLRKMIDMKSNCFGTGIDLAPIRVVQSRLQVRQ